MLNFVSELKFSKIFWALGIEFVVFWLLTCV